MRPVCCSTAFYISCVCTGRVEQGK